MRRVRRGEPADSEYDESSGMSATLRLIPLTTHRMVGLQTRKKKTIALTLRHPPPLTQPHLHSCLTIPLPAAASHPARPASSALSAHRTGTLRWKSRFPRHEKGSRPSNVLPSARTMNPKSPRSGTRRSASHAFTTESARLLVYNRPKGVRRGSTASHKFAH